HAVHHGLARLAPPSPDLDTGRPPSLVEPAPTRPCKPPAERFGETHRHPTDARERTHQERYADLHRHALAGADRIGKPHELRGRMPFLSPFAVAPLDGRLTAGPAGGRPRSRTGAG